MRREDTPRYIRRVDGDDATPSGLSSLRPKTRHRIAHAVIRFDGLGPDAIDGFDIELLSVDGAALAAERFVFVEPHVPALSEIMSDVSDRLGVVRLDVDMASFHLGERGRSLTVAVHPHRRDEYALT
jgi:hypothetical protein